MKEGCGCKGCDCHSTCNCSCHQKGSGEECGSCKDKHDEYMNYFLEIADCAWEEVLKEKIKEHILQTQGDRMRELAKIVSEANGERWKRKMEKKRCCHSFKEKLSQFFGGGGCCK